MRHPKACAWAKGGEIRNCTLQGPDWGGGARGAESEIALVQGSRWGRTEGEALRWRVWMEVFMCHTCRVGRLGGLGRFAMRG